MTDEDDLPAAGQREDGWDRRCAQVIALAMDHGFERLVAGLGTVRADRRPDVVRVCAVGGFGTGKTHLINQLAGTYALDESPAVVPRAVRAGRVGHAVREADGTVLLDNSWLRGAGLELLDIPGLWGDDGRRAPEAASAALGADAVVMTVRAVGGADMQERALLGRLAAHPGGAVLLVVTMLDEVAGDRDAVMARYRRIAEAAGENVEVFAGPGGDLVRPRWPENLDALRDRLGVLGTAPGPRPRRIARVLSTVCGELESLAEEALAAGEASAAGGTGEARRAGDLEHRAALARWSAVRLEVSAKRDRLRAQVVERAALVQAEVLDDVRRRVADHADPKSLWLDELAAELHVRMSDLIAEDESLIGEAYRKDVRLVASELDAIAGPRPPMELTGPSGEGGPAFDDGSSALDEAAGRLPMFSAETIDTLGEIAGEAGTLLTELLLSAVVPSSALPPLPPVLGDVVQPRVGERLVERQRGAVRDAARLVLAGYVAEALRRGDDRITDLYDRLLDAGEERLGAWWAARIAVWDRPEREAADWRRLRTEARHLRTEITRAAHDGGGEPWNPPEEGSRTGRAGGPG